MPNRPDTTCRYCGHADEYHKFTSVADPDTGANGRIAVYDCDDCDWNWCVYVVHTTTAELATIVELTEAAQ